MATPAPPIVELQGVTKRYAGTTALLDAGITIEPGQIHGLLGQNGSGKSTLIKVLAGVVAPDAGTLRVRGEAVSLPLTPLEAERRGFRFVHQNLGLVPALTVAENLFLTGFAHGVVKPIGWRQLFADAGALLAQYDVDADPHAPLDRLSPLQRAQVAIVRALAPARDNGEKADGGNLLVLDEPTVYLPRKEVASLFALVDRVVSRGAGVLIVTHRMDEILEHTHQATVLRDARVVSSRATGATDEAELVKDIVGVEWARERRTTSSAADVSEVDGDPVQLAGLATRRLHDLQLEVCPGRILGLTGLAGSGYDELIYACFGASAKSAGRLRIGDTELDLARLTPRGAMDHGICLVPADRLRQGVAATMTIEENLSLPLLGRYFSGGALRLGRMRRAGDGLIGEYSIKCRDREAEVSSLSGGNQQKVVIAKWLQTRPRLILLHEPTQGVDVRARHDIWTSIRALAAAGSVVLVASSDYEELATLCTQVAIVADGRITRSMSGDDLSIDAISTACLLSGTATESEQASHVA